ncbi:MAG: hypothetical protein H0U19_11965 [Acidobacteria bacterium]|nr:hypothetical protein [Acidobacteriota bacterium]
MPTSQAERLLSLFTSADRASAIAGDLTEERDHRGPIVFWLDVVRTMSALWTRAVTDAPLRVLMLALSGCVLLVGPAFVGIAAIALFPGAIGSPVGWSGLSLAWCAGALWTGASLVGCAPSRGLAACATLALVGETLLIAFLARAPVPELPMVPLVIAYATSLAVPPLLLVGGAIARRRLIFRGLSTQEHHR